ncbi:MAG TPA: serine/threonine-protein kinase, partial [Planctomycetia bacterium]|nr:serine/threonine-protein kinase [Planctomycetia bacterium]
MRPDFPVLPGYTITRRIARGASGEVYEARAPGEFAKAIKIVRFDPRNPLTHREMDGVGLIRSVRHPFLIAIDRVDVNDDEIVIVMELADGNLRDELRAARNCGRPGVPRPQLLNWMLEAAEVLDFLNFRHQVRHLDVKPENLLLISGHLKVGDFGLARHASLDTFGHRSHAGTPAYAPPELFDSEMSPSSDQYSLAVAFMELAGAGFPYQGKNAVQYAMRQLSQPPRLEGLPESERPILARALAVKPDDRHPRCVDFVRALLEVHAEDPEFAAGDDIHDAGPPGSGQTSRLGPRSGGSRAGSARNLAKSVADDDSSIFRPAPPPEQAALESASAIGLPGSGTVGDTLFWAGRRSPEETLARLTEFAAARGAAVICLGEGGLRLNLVGGPRGWRPLLGVRDPFCLTVQICPRRDGEPGSVVVTAIEHHGAALPEVIFAAHCKAIVDDLARALSLHRSARFAMRSSPRRRFIADVMLTPLQG